MSGYEPRIYTAGAMDWTNSEDSYWRESVDVEVDGVEFSHPTETWFDHGGDQVDGIVAEDMAMINRCDGVVGLFSETPQTGTVTEVVHAAAIGKPVLAMFTRDVLSPPAFDMEPRTTVVEDGAVFRIDSTDMWFLVNYLTGDDPGGDRMTTAPAPPHIREWENGNATVVTLANDEVGTIGRVVASWVENSLSDVDAEVDDTA